MPEFSSIGNSETIRKGVEGSAPGRRQTAYKIKIKKLLEEKYVKTDGWNPNFIIVDGVQRIFRVNVMGTVISNELESFGSMAYRNIVIDDGTGTIGIRNFENPDSLSGIEVADVILVIGKLREYGSERYILPEIVKKIRDPRWIEQRNLEIELINRRGKQVVADLQKSEKNRFAEELVGEERIEEAEEIKRGDSERIYALVSELDAGDGADYEMVIKKAGSKDAEKIIRKLLESGEIFEIRAGKLKVI